MKTAIAFSLCIVAVLSTTVPTTLPTDVPDECSRGASTYNETLCAGTCAKDVHKLRSYCSNFVSSSTDKEVVQSTEDLEATLLTAVSNQTSRSTSTASPNTTHSPNSGMNLKSSLTYTAFSFLFLNVFL